MALRVALIGFTLAIALAALTHEAAADFEPTVEPDLEQAETELERGGHTHLGRGPIDFLLQPYDQLRETANQKLGLDWAIAYSYLYQHRSHGGEDQWTNNSEIDVFFNWDLFETETFGNGSITGLFSRIWEHRNGATTGELTASSGTVFNTSDSDKLEALRQLYWTQSIADDRVQIHLGQVELPTFIDDNSYANNDRDKYIAQVWTKTTRSTVNVFGLGSFVSIQPNDLFYLRAGFVDGNTNGQNPKLSTFKRGEYVYAGEIGITPDIPGWGPGVYRVSPFYADESDIGEQGTGINISFEQQTPWDLALWLRGSLTDDRRNALESFLGGGVVLTNPFGFERDRIGLAFGWGKPDDSEARDNTYLAEGYWRAQLTERLEFGPGLQLHINPANNRNRDVVAVGSLRALVRF